MSIVIRSFAINTSCFVFCFIILSISLSDDPSNDKTWLSIVSLGLALLIISATSTALV